MSSIPLPALDIRPSQPNDPLGSFQKLMALRSLANEQQIQQQQSQALSQENQQRQIQLNDTQAMSQAMRSWDGKDINDLPNLIIKNGGSANAVFGMRKHILDYQTAKEKLSSDQLANEKNLNDQIAGHLQTVLDAKPADQPAAFEAAKADLLPTLQKIDPVKAQQLSAAQYQGPEQIAALQKLHMAKSQIDESALKVAQTREAAERGTEAQAGAEQKRMESAFYQQGGVGAPGVPAETTEMLSALRQNPGLTPATYPAWKAQQVAQAEMPSKIAASRAEGEARAQVEHQYATAGNAALANVPSHLVAPATAAATKAGEDFAQAKSVSDRLQAMMDAAKKGNVVSYQLIPQEGALQVTTSQGVHRINMAEIQNYGGGSLWQRLEGHIGKQLTGKSIPDSVLNDMAEMQDIQTRGAQAKYENSLKTINQTYGANFKPIEMATMNPSQTAQSNSATIQYTPGLIRNGYKFKGGDPTKKENWEKQ